MRTSTAGLVVLALGLAGCGTTVPVTTTRSSGVGLSGPAGSGGDLGGSLTAGGSASGTTGAPVASPSRPVTTAPSPVASTGPVTYSDGLVLGQGVTATTIYVGVTYVTNADAANTALGAGNLTSGDVKADAQAVIDEINAGGGIHGKKLVPVFYGYQAQSTQTGQQQDSAACAAFTQDHQVAVVWGFGSSDELPNCLARAHVPQLASGQIIYDDEQDFRQWPLYYELGTLSQDRMMAEEVRSLVRQRYFTPWDNLNGRPGTAPVKVGVLSLDLGQWHRPGTKVLLPALAAAGYPVDPVNYHELHSPNSQAEVGRTVSDLQSAVLSLHENGVTHLILLDGNGSLLLLYGNDAKNQGYYPRLGINTAAGATQVASAHEADNKELNGAMGLGWIPIADLLPSEEARYEPAAAKHCAAVIRKWSGQVATSATDAGNEKSFCDDGFLTAQALRSTTNLTPEGLRAAIDAIGDAFQSSALPRYRFSPTQHAPAELGWDMHWVTDCTCLRYSRQVVIP